MSDVEADPAAEVRLNRLLNLMLEAAVDLLGIDAATASTRHDGHFASVGLTDVRMLPLDEAQYQARQGPCVTVLDPHDPIIWTAQDDHNPDWLAYREAAVDAGVEASLSVHVPTDADLGASLNLYAKRRLDFSAGQVAAAQATADQIGITLQSIDSYRAAERLARGLAEAMRNRAIIEQAKGILMAERQIDADQAFALLVRLSQNSNTKLREAAARFVEARTGHAAMPTEQ